MFVSHNREKLIHAIIYFLRNTNHCHTLKLFKLLNFSDFEHYRQTGRTITGLDYYAWDKGPVPRKLFFEIKGGADQDLREAISLFEVKDGLTDKLLRRDLKPRKDFDARFFSKREIRVLERVAEFFRDLRAEDMSEFSHWKGLPWQKVYDGGKGKGKQIPLALTFESDPLMHDVPRIEQDDLEFRREMLKDTA